MLHLLFLFLYIKQSDKSKRPLCDRLNKAQEISIENIRSVGPPSSLATCVIFGESQKKFNILCHRPTSSNVGHPVKWYHKIFRDFVDDSTNQVIEPSKNFYDASVELCNIMCKIYSNENERCLALDNVLQLFGLDFIQITLDDKSSNDGISGKNLILNTPAHFELKLLQQ